MSQQQRILYIEDDESAQLIGSYALQTIARQNVQLCDSGRRAIEMIREFKPDLILLDVVMPELDGFATLELIRAEQIDTPVIFMSAEDGMIDPDALAQANVMGMIGKPFDPLRLWEQIRSLLPGNRAKPNPL